jgi:hypothetical protein
MAELAIGEIVAAARVVANGMSLYLDNMVNPTVGKG